MSLKFKILFIILIIYLILSVILCICFFTWRNKFSRVIEKQMLNSDVLNLNFGSIKSVKIKMFSFPISGNSRLEYNIKSEKGKFTVITEMGMLDNKIIAKKYVIKNKDGEIYEIYEN